MKILLKKICIFLSASAVIILNLSTDKKEPIISCIVFLSILWILILRSKNEIFIKPFFPLNNIYSIFSLVICSAMGCNFYSAWLNSFWISKLSKLLGISDNNYIVLFFSVLGTLASIPIVVILITNFSKTVIVDFEKSSITLDSKNRGISIWKSYAILTVIFLIGISAILRANFYYIDDMGRTAQGYRGWDDFSRFISNGLSTIIHTDTYITDISPFTQLIAVLTLATSGIILLYVIYERRTFSILELIAVIPLGLNPYFLECISYKFDAPFMALSILAAIFPLLFRNSSTPKYITASTIGTIMVCSTYQAASGIFPMTVLLVSLNMWLKNRPWQKILRFIFNSTIGFGLGLVFFKQIIMIPTDVYVSNALPSIGKLFPTIISNYQKYFNLILTDYKTLWKLIIVLLIVAFLASSLNLSSRKKLLTLGITLATGSLMLLLCFGIYPILTKPSFSPRAMYGFGVFLSLLCISTSENSRRMLLKLPAITVSWIFFIFAFTYGNALFIQKTYTDFRITQVISDLDDMEIFLNDDTITVQISGTIGYSPIVYRMNAEYNILCRLVPVTFRETWWWGTFGFYNYYGLKNIKKDNSIDLTSYNLPIIKDGMYHTIYGDDHYILVKLK